MTHPPTHLPKLPCVACLAVAAYLAACPPAATILVPSLILAASILRPRPRPMLMFVVVPALPAAADAASSAAA